SVRAADFRHIGVSLDGLSVPWPLHLVRGRDDTGSIALVNSDVLDSVTLAPAAYPQRAGARTGAWIDFGLREGSRTTPRFHGAVGATNAAAVAEGPIAGGRGSWLAAVRKSYLDWLLRALSEEDGTTTAFGFLDTQSKVVFDLTSRQQIQVMAVAGRSALHEGEVDPGPNSIREGDADTAIVTLGVRSIIGGTVLRQRALFVSQGFYNEGDFGQMLGEGTSRDVGYQADLRAQAWRRLSVEAGAEFRDRHESRTLLDYTIRQTGAPLEVRRTDAYSGSSSLGAGYAHLLWSATDRLSISPGFRVAHATITGETTATPWLQAAWRGDAVSLRAGMGSYQQFPEFDQLLSASGHRDLSRERASHFDLSVEHRLTPAVRWQANVYVRDENDMIRLEDSETRLVDGMVQPAGIGRYANALSGTARGVELTIERRTVNGLTGWASYAFGRARYRDRLTGESYWADFDQRHSLNLFAQYRLSGRTNVSAKLRIGSNVPIPGYFEARDGSYYVGETRNTVRLPTYARLDLRADRTFNFTRRRLTLFVEVLNALGRSNYGPADGFIRLRTLEAVDYVEKLFPLLPAAGILIEF
ncbi:MAG TPA: TonB-dependent receptor, partial [Vicinamibacterales bacterium]|nr:TonB-dependent receptor [Vicinamibacterales bacterium]